MSERNRLLAVSMGYTRPTYTLYPVTAAGGTTLGVTSTPAAGAWGLYADLIAAAAITVEFWLMEVVFDTFAGAFGAREVQIFNATEARRVYECRAIATAATANLAPFRIPIPVYTSPNAQIQVRSGATNAADTTNVSILVATGL